MYLTKMHEKNCKCKDDINPRLCLKYFLKKVSKIISKNNNIMIQKFYILFGDTKEYGSFFFHCVMLSIFFIFFVVTFTLNTVIQNLWQYFYKST